MSEPRRPHPIVRRLSTSARRAVDGACSSLRRVVRNPMPIAEQASAWLKGTPTAEGGDGPLGKARLLEAAAFLGLCEVDRAAQACTEAISTLEEEMEEKVDAVIPLRDTIGKLASCRTDLETERTRLMEQHRDRKAERVALEKHEEPGQAKATHREPPPSSPVAGALHVAGEKVTDFMDEVTAAVGRRLPFVKR